MAANPVSPTPELQLDTENKQTETIVHCVGRVTSSTSHILRDAVREIIAEKKAVVLDLSNVSYMDSSGLGTLVGVWVTAKREGVPMKLVSLSQRVKELLRLTRLDDLLATSRFPDTPSF